MARVPESDLRTRLDIQIGDNLLSSAIHCLYDLILDLRAAALHIVSILRAFSDPQSCGIL